jgi:hypothetical protein
MIFVWTHPLRVRNSIGFGDGAVQATMMAMVTTAAYFIVPGVTTGAL